LWQFATGSAPEVLEAIGRKLAVPHRVLNILVTKEGLKRPRIMARIGQGEGRRRAAACADVPWTWTLRQLQRAQQMAGHFSPCVIWLKSRLAFPSQHPCSGGGTAMDKPIGWWRSVDALMIVGSLVIIVVGIWIAYWQRLGAERTQGNTHGISVPMCYLLNRQQRPIPIYSVHCLTWNILLISPALTAGFFAHRP
jgi:hypothetical protein